MDILQVQDRLKNFSQDQLVSEMQAPTGNAPQFLVLSEIMRRKRLQDDFSAQQGKEGSDTTVAQEAVAAAGVPQGGIADMARSMAPNTDIARDTGVQAMASGGTVRKMQVGGAVLTDPAIISMANRSGMSVEEFLSSLSPEEAANLQNYATRNATRSRMTAMEPVGEYATQADLDKRYAETVALPDILPAEPSTPTPMAMDYGTPIYDTLLGRTNTLVPRGGAGPTEYEQYVQNQMAAVDAAQPQFPPEPVAPVFAPASSEAGPSMPPPVSLDRAAAFRAGTAVQPTPAPSFEGLDRRAQFEPVGEGMGLSYLPPEMDAASFARRSMDARPLTEILTPEVLSREETVREMDRMAMVGAGAPRPPEPQEDPMTVAARESAEAAAVERTAEGKTQSLKTPAEAAAAVKAARDATQGEGDQSDGPQGGGGSGIAGAASGITSYEQELMDALTRREKAATQDKWLALAQVGLNMMSSKQPTLLGAVGEAGLSGVQAMQGARDQYEKDRIDLTGALEQSRMSRAKAVADAARSGIAGAKVKPINSTMIGNIEKQLAETEGQLAMLAPPSEPSFWSGEIDDPDAAARDALERRAGALKQTLSYAYATHGLPSVYDMGSESSYDGDMSDPEE